MFFKKALILTVPSLLLVCTLTATTTPNSSATIQKMNQMPLAFTQNNGQWDSQVLFRANAGGATMWFTKEGVTYRFTRRIDNGNLDVRRGTLHVPAGTRSVPLHGTPQLAMGDDHFGDTRDSIEQLILTTKLVGANPNPEIIAEGLMEYKCNYFLGNDPSKWHTDVPNYEAIRLKDIYPGIDLKYSGDGDGQAAYEFIAAPGADITQIKVTYEGAEETSLDADGRLILQTKWGDMIAAIKSPASSPRSLGEGSGVRAVLSGGTSCAWLTSSSTKSSPDLAHGDVRQALAKNSGALALSYSTFLGGEGDDGGYSNGIAVDSDGSAYVTGLTYSASFPTQNPYQGTIQGVSDVFITKFSSAGNDLIYSTYLGGSSNEINYIQIVVDGSGNAYVTGCTESSNFPTLNPYQTDQIGSDAFVTKLSNSGNSLIYSTYLGGGRSDAGRGIAVDGSGNACVTGFTRSSDFPTLNPYQATYRGGYSDAFVTKLSSFGNGLIYSTYLGGGSDDGGEAIAFDDSGSAYVTGETSSTDFPTLNPYQGTKQGGVDVFVARLPSSGNGLIYSTYLGGGNLDAGYGIAIDNNGNAYVTGLTESSNFPTVNPYQSTFQGGNRDIFVAKLSSIGDNLIYSTYLGGSGDENYYGGGAIAVDGNSANVTGYTNSSDFPTFSPYQSTFQGGGNDVFVTKFSDAGNSLIYSTYLGGGGEDEGYSIAVDGSGNAYVTGWTYSYDFPTSNPYQTTHQDGRDVFVTKLSWTPDYICGDADGERTINIADAVYLIDYIFSGGPAPSQLAAGDADCDGAVNIADAVYLIDYIFCGGPAPCAGCK